MKNCKIFFQIAFISCLFTNVAQAEYASECRDMEAFIDSTIWDVTLDSETDHCKILPRDGLNQVHLPVEKIAARSSNMYSMVFTATSEDLAQLWRDIIGILRPLKEERRFFSSSWALRRTASNTLTYYFLVQPIFPSGNELLDEMIAEIQGASLSGAVMSFVNVDLISTNNFLCSGILVQESENDDPSDIRCGGKKWRDSGYLNTSSLGLFYTSLLEATQDVQSLKREMEFSRIPEVLSVMPKLERFYSDSYAKRWARSTGFYFRSDAFAVRRDNIIHPLLLGGLGFRNCFIEAGTTCSGRIP